MSTVAASDGRARAGGLSRLSPLVLLAVAMPWLLEWGIVLGVSMLAPAYDSLVTRLADGILYPIVTGSIVLVGLYAALDTAARRSLFLFRRPSRRELFAVAGALVVGYALAALAQFGVVAVFGVEPASAPGGEVGLRWFVVFAVIGGVFAPLVEEVLFRGLLLGYLVERDVPRIAAGGVVVALFGATHYYDGPAQIASAIVIGTIAVWLRFRYDNLVSPVLFHSFTNLTTALLILGAA